MIILPMKQNITLTALSKVPLTCSWLNSLLKQDQNKARGLQSKSHSFSCCVFVFVVFPRRQYFNLLSRREYWYWCTYLYRIE